MKIFVTGGTGYIGRVLIPMLIENGYEVKVLDRMFLNYDDVAEDYKQYGAQIIKDDIRYFDPHHIKGQDAVIDLAALSNDPSGDLDPLKTWDINYLGRVRVARLAKKLGVTKYIVASSCSVYGFREDIADENSMPNPLTTYAQANIAVEHDNLPLSDHDFSSTALRFATAFGYSKRMRFDLAVNAMSLYAHRDGVIKLMRDGEQFRPFVHIIDISRAIINVLNQSPDIVRGETFNIGSDSLNVKLKDLAEIVRKSTSINSEIEWYGDKDTRSYRVSFKKAREILNFSTKVSIEAGVKEIIEKLKTNELQDVIETHTMEFYKKLIQSEQLVQEHGLTKSSKIL